MINEVLFSSYYLAPCWQPQQQKVMVIIYVADISHLFSSLGKVDCTFEKQ